MNTYRFLAECDVEIWELQKVTGQEIKSIRIIKIDYSGIETEVKTNMSLEELRDKMRQTKDGHVMIQTVAEKDQYTGIRDFSIS